MIEAMLVEHGARDFEMSPDGVEITDRVDNPHPEQMLLEQKGLLPTRSGTMVQSVA